MIYKVICERFPMEFEKAVNQALSEGYELLGGPFGWRDSLHQAVTKREDDKSSTPEAKN
jgi:hypothetical protein